MPGARPTGVRHPDGHYSCRRCRHEWLPRDAARAPRKCPHCWAWLDKPYEPGGKE